MENFGGHALAAGFTVREENIPALAQALRQGVTSCCQGADLPSVLEVDMAVQPHMLTVAAVEALDLLEPCGTGNPRPVLLLQGAQVHTLSQVGRGRHLKMKLEARGISLDAIWFSADAEETGLYPGCRVDVVFYPQINEFRGRRDLQLQIVDLRVVPSRAQMERSIYEKFSRGELLTVQEAQFLLPSREDFVGLWRWLERQSASGSVVEDTPVRIARAVSRSSRQREVPARTMLCLEVMEERKVTVDGVTREVPAPFLVIATQNPAGAAGTQYLPEAQMERFMVSLSLGYPDYESELAMAKEIGPEEKYRQIQPVLTGGTLLEIQRDLPGIYEGCDL